MNAEIAEALASCNQLLEPSALANKPMSLERDVPLRGEQLGPGRIREYAMLTSLRLARASIVRNDKHFYMYFIKYDKLISDAKVYM